MGAHGPSQPEGDADTPVPQILEDVEEMTRLVRHELRERITKDVIDFLARVQVAFDVPVAQVQQRTAEPSVCPAPQTLVEIAEANQPDPQVRTAERIFEPHVDVPGSKSQELLAEAVKDIPKERFTQRIGELFVNVPGGLIQLTPQARHPERIAERFADLPGPHVQE